MSYTGELRDRLSESERYPRSREWWTRDRTTLKPQCEVDWPTPNFKLSDFATPDEIAVAIAGVKQTWRDMGRRVKELNQELSCVVPPQMGTRALQLAIAFSSVPKTVEQAQRNAWQAVSDWRDVRKIGVIFVMARLTPVSATITA
jgi:hypothetical protein